MKMKRISFRALAPNIVTILAMTAGLTGMQLALKGRYEEAVLAIVIAGVFDGIDGGIARLLKSASRFGAELDSLSDVISFGVAPAIILYIWSLSEMPRGGWMIAMLLAICCALRLARFNSRIDEADEPIRKSGFLTGFPSPFAAGLSLVPMMLWFETGNDVFRDPLFVAGTTVFVCMGMVSRLPTYTIKQLFIRRDQMVPVLLVIGVIAAGVTTYGWAMLTLIGIAYILLLPFSIFGFRKWMRQQDDQ